MKSSPETFCTPCTCIFLYYTNIFDIHIIFITDIIKIYNHIIFDLIPPCKKENILF